MRERLNYCNLAGAPSSSAPGLVGSPHAAFIVALAKLRPYTQRLP